MNRRLIIKSELLRIKHEVVIPKKRIKINPITNEEIELWKKADNFKEKIEEEVGNYGDVGIEMMKLIIVIMIILFFMIAYILIGLGTIWEGIGIRYKRKKKQIV